MSGPPVSVASGSLPPKPVPSVAPIDSKKELKDEKPASSPAPKKEREEVPEVSSAFINSLTEKKNRCLRLG